MTYYDYTLRDVVAGLELVLERTAAAEKMQELDEVLLRTVKAGVIKHSSHRAGVHGGPTGLVRHNPAIEQIAQ